MWRHIQSRCARSRLVVLTFRDPAVNLGRPQRSKIINKPPDSTTRLMALYPGISGLDDDTKSQLVACARRIEVPAGTYAFRKGDPCKNFILVLEGRVRVQISSEAGREVALYRVQPGATCALTTSCLIGNEEYPAEALVEEDITAMMIPDRDFRQILLDSEGFRQFVFQSFSRRLCNIVTRMEAVALKTIDERLAKQLLMGDDNSLSSITHQVLAAEIGTAREVVSRKLKRFEADGLIRLVRGRVEILDRENLEVLSGGSET